MSVTVGAALKKIAVALLSDKKTLKKAAMAILVVIVALFMPMAAIITVVQRDAETGCWRASGADRGGDV